MPSPPRLSDLAQLPPTPPAALHDPFLAQIHSRNIPITERDRQEGYDVDLVHAQPRGPAHPAPGSGPLEALERHSIGNVPIAAGAAGAGTGTRAGTGAGAAYGEYSDDEGKRESTTAGASYGGITSTDPFLLEGAGGAGEHGAETTKKQRSKQWILRPLPLAVIVAFLCALALALGLGIGLTQRSSVNRAAAAASTVTSMRHTTATPAASGTVVPSSAYATTTTRARASSVTASTALANGPIATALSSSVSSIVTSLATSSPTSSTSKALASPITSTVYASTGDLPIPADSETTRDGTVYSVESNVNKRGYVATAPPVGPTAFVRAARRP